MLNIVCYVGIFSLLASGCSTPEPIRPPFTAEASAQQAFIEFAEKSAEPPARNVLFTLRQMVQNREIVQGGCWDYLHAGFNRAGIPTKRRQTLFSGTLRGGPYAPAELLEPGDWLYYVNHSYNDIEHSGVFIGWTDYEQRQGLILSYAGEGRGEPGRYKVYDLSHVYQVTRPR